MGPRSIGKSLIVGTALVALAAVGVAVYLWRQNAELQRQLEAGPRAARPAPSEQVRIVREGDELPEFASRDSEGREVKVAARGGKASLLLIYTPMCDRCESGLPAWTRVATKLKELEAPVQVVAISTAPSYETVQHARERMLPFAPVVFPDAEVQKKYGVAEVPLTVAVDARGIVQAVWAGPLDEGHVGDVIETVCPQCVEPAVASGSSAK